MNKLEVLRVTDCDLGIKFHEIIDHFPNLKRLEIDKCKGENYWFIRKYPTLEHLEIAITEFFRGIPMFLELNPNIRKLATLSATLWTLRDEMMISNIKIDDLAIKIGYENDLMEKNNRFKLLCELFNELHERGFYKKLQLYLDFYIYPSQERINLLADVKGLDKLSLSLSDSSETLSVSALTSLEEICVGDSKVIADLEVLPNNLINLKRIFFEFASIDDIMLFIRRSVEMQKIKVDLLIHGVHFNRDTRVMNLLALNREREQLPDAAKITLYVEEDIYLATKWALGETDLRLIRLKRKTSFRWRNDFGGIHCAN